MRFPCLGLLAALSLLAGCATPQPPQEALPFKSRPRSIVILPPVNESADTRASYSVYSFVTPPLAEAGYYVLPVTLVDETFRQNGFSSPGDIQQISPAKLKEIFGADSALYLAVERYGASYQLIDSVNAVTVRGKLLDLRTEETLWENRATAVEPRPNNQGGLVGMLVDAVVRQVITTLRDDPSEQQAAQASHYLLMPGISIPYGPRSPRYKESP